MATAKALFPPNPVPSSSPAFATPIHPIRPHNPVAATSKPATILPILLPPASLRPLAFRTFTKKHNLALTSSALQSLATFIGKHCGPGWREEGLAEQVLEEVAKQWKKSGGPVIVEGDADQLKLILRNLDGCMSGGRITERNVSLSRQSSFAFGGQRNLSSESRNGRPEVEREDSQGSFGFSALRVEEDGKDQSADPRSWLKVINAFDQPRLVYDMNKKHFEKSNVPASLFPPPAHKTHMFRQRYHLIHQRLLRNESFQTPSFGSGRATLQRSASTFATVQQSYKITPIANLLGRSGSSHLLLGMLTVAPTGNLAIYDLTGSIAIDLQHAKAIPENGAWFTPGMIVLIDGVYEEEYNAGGAGLGNQGGIGGYIGGKFIGFSIGGPPCERRATTLGTTPTDTGGDVNIGGGFGWVDFLGVGSERVSGTQMRRLEKSLLDEDAEHHGNGKMIVIGEINLDNPKCLEALKKILGSYAAQPASESPMIFVLTGNFVRDAAMAGGGGGGSIEYKECFDSLASVLTEYPTILKVATFLFVPGDNDPWASAFSAGAAVPLPRKGIPELFTSRIKRAFAATNAEGEKSGNDQVDGEAIWTTNPARLSLFGPAHEVVLFRDDMSGRLRRNAVNLSMHPDEEDTQVKDQNAAMSETLPGADNEIGVDSAQGGTFQNPDVDPAVQRAESHLPVPPLLDTNIAPPLAHSTHIARKLVKTLLDQSHLSSFPLSTRPVLWDYASALQLYPLPTALVLVDPEAPAFCLTYEGCHVMNPGSILMGGRDFGGRGCRWIEYDLWRKRGSVRECAF